MDKKQKTALIAIGCAVGAYLIYKWYVNRQAANASGSTGNTQLGTNLNSVLTGLSSGPSTELNYYGTSASTTTSTPVTTGGTGSSGSTGTGSSGSGSGSGTGGSSGTSGSGGKTGGGPWAPGGLAGLGW